VIDRLEALRVPSVAVIHGFCLGGGLARISHRSSASGLRISD
jgi:enoyl-CoA hydratase/carnithine racemase